MGEESVSSGLVWGELNSTWLLLIAGMAILASLAGVFTFCMRRKNIMGNCLQTSSSQDPKERANDAVSRRKKTDEISPDDRVPGTETETKSTRQTETKPTDTQPASDGRIQAKGPDENGVNPVITEVDRESEASVAVGGQSEHRDEDVPVINGHNDEAVEEAGVRREEATESGVEEVGRSQDLQKEEEENPVTEETGEEEEPTPVIVETLTNGFPDSHAQQEVTAVDGDVVAMVNGRLEKSRWSFPPELEEFDLMESDADPTELEQMFADDRLVEIYLELEPESPGLGISIVGGNGSPSGDLPIIIKRVLPGSLADRDGRLKVGDELIAVNETLLVGVRKDAAIETLTNMSGRVRLLALQDD